MRIHRRNFLRGLGATVALPMLPSLNAYAQDGNYPKRLLIMFSANGTVPATWIPSGGETDFQLSDILQPLAPHRDHLLILEGVDMVSARNGIGDGHQKGMAHMLTGTELLPGPFQGGGGAGTAGYAGGISVDQHIANEVGQNDVFKSLEFGVQCGGSNNWSRMSYSGPDAPVAPETNPYNAFDRIFRDIGGDPFGLERIRAQRQSVLDFVKDDFDSIRNKVAQADLHRIDAHFDHIRSLEGRLSMGNDLGVACEQPNLGQQINPDNNDNFPVVGQLMMDMIVMAFACNLTKVATMQFSRSVSGTRFPWVGVDDRHHDLSHEGDNNADAVTKLTTINRWYAEQFAYLCDQMKQIPEGNGTMLDNTVIVWCNELGKGNSHTRNNVPYVMAGSGGGHFQTGRFLEYNDDPHNNLLVSLCNAMGVQTNTFGNPAYCTGPLAGLTG